MKKSVKSFISLTRTERIGLIGISALLVVLICIRATMHLWLQPQQDMGDQQKLVTAWEAFKRDNAVANTTDTTSHIKKDYQDAFDDNTTPLPDIINLNTADSATLVRLNGIGPATAHKIVARRKNAGLFTDVNQLREIGHFPSATFDLLKKHLTTDK